MDKAKKKQLKKAVVWTLLAALVVLLAVMPLLARQEQEQEGPAVSILSGTVQQGAIESGLRGGGTLSAGNQESVILPTGVRITEFLVKNGDLVQEGTPVAAVDKVSVMTAIVEVRETLDYLREEIADAEQDSVDSVIPATAGGLVKQVFARKDDKVEDVMLEHGALAVLSLDGMMAVELEADTVYAAGDSLRVLVNGKEVSGRVESNLDGILVVTIEDDKYEVGTAARVLEKNGNVLGEDELFVHNAWKAMAFQGTVKSVSARENTQVSDGATLFTLADTDFAGNQAYLASLHREYEEVLQDLFAMHESGVLTAPCDGLVSGVDTDSEFLLSAIEGEQGWFADLLENPEEEKGWTVMLLSSTAGTACTKDETCTAETHEDGCPMKCTQKEGCTAQVHEPGCAFYCTLLPDCANPNHKTGCQGVCTGNSSCQSTRPAEYHLDTCVKRCVSSKSEDPADKCTAKVHYPACIENCTKTDACTALTHKEGCPFHGVTYTARAVKVVLSGVDGLKVVYGTTTYQVEPSGSGWTLAEPAQLQDLFLGESQDMKVADPTQYPQGTILLLVTGTNSSGAVVHQSMSVYQRGPGTGGLPDGVPGFDMGALLAGMGGMGGLPGGYGFTPDFELFDLDGDPIMTVTEQDVVTLSVTLDEQDIAKVSPGQLAQVKVNPLKDRVFEAEVTDIGNFGSSSGGSGKFSVELTMDLEEDMIPGMSATAYLPLYTKMDVLTIPVAALAEEEGRTVVYTALDEKTGEPCDPVDVTVGISDGKNAEILAGLENGQTYYYRYYDTLELSADVETDSISFGG